MSEYDILEQSVEDSAPYELYEFIGTYKNYYFTSDSIQHTFQGSIYKAISGLSRKALKIGTHDTNGIDLTIEIPITQQIIKDYGFQETPPSLTVAIYRLQRNSSEFAVIWKGEITAITISNEIATLRSPSKFGKLLASNIPNVYIQPPCNNVLFDERCQLSRASNTLNTNVATIISRSQITIPNLGVFPDGRFLGGEISISGKNERRTIIEQTGVSLTVNYDFSQIEIGNSIEVTVGCDHSFEGASGCSSFNNQKNFGGCPYVPGESNNVFQVGV